MLSVGHEPEQKERRGLLYKCREHPCYLWAMNQKKERKVVYCINVESIHVIFGPRIRTKREKWSIVYM